VFRWRNTRKVTKTVHELPVKRIFPVVFLMLAVSACRTQEAYFSPNGGCTEAIVREISSSRKSILVQSYSFTSAPIAKALVAAHKRGVNVEVILDQNQRTESHSSADFLHNMGVPTRIDDNHAIAHDKVMILDGQVVITGSFNFTKSAEENNAENLLVIRDPQLAAKYAENWNKHAAHAEEYGGRVEPPPEASPPTSMSPLTLRGPAITTGFIASKNSQVFHRPNCESVSEILPKNIVRYAIREEATRAGRKPCAECNP
jgi:phosphatidylserine/phosphatidylglycerophosphate/cardiolipin synthase-like enzyme